MDIKTFFEKFELFAHLPDAVTRMRDLVLGLAVRGKLVPQNDTDESAEHLIKRAYEHAQKLDNAAKLQRLAKEGEARLDTAEFPPLPRNWVWTCSAIIGDTAPRVDAHDSSLVAFAPMHLLPTDYRSIFKPETRSWREIKKGYTHFANGDVGFAKITPCFQNGKGCVFSNLPGGMGAGTTELHVLRPFTGVVMPLYALLFYKSPEFVAGGVASFSGTAGQQRVSNDYFRFAPFPLPPLAEQKQIVAKVDEMMALCDRLEAQQQERQANHAILARAALARFAEAPTPANLEYLFHKSYTIDPAEIRKTILSMAVQGKLVTQTGSRASASLGAILAEPSSNGVSKGPTADENAVQVLRISAGTSRNDFYVDEDDYKFVALSTDEVAKHRLQANDLLACRFNGNLHFVGRFSIYGGLSNRIQVNPDKLIRFRIDTSKHSAEYICYAMNAAPTRQIIEAMCATTAGNIGLSAGRIKTVAIPLPPLAEQNQIVAKVQQLMALVDKLEAQLTTSSAVGEKLMEAVVAELTRSAPPNGAASSELEIKPDDARIAAAGQLACYILNQWREVSDVGRTKLEKAIDFSQNHCGVPLDRHAIRYKHGPVDYELLRSAEAWAGEHGGFTTHNPGHHERVLYTPGEQIASHAEEAMKIIGTRQAEVDRVLGLLAPLSTARCGYLATIYNAWKSLLGNGKVPNDRDIIRVCRHEWHKSKEKVADRSWFWAIRFLEANKLTP